LDFRSLFGIASATLLALLVMVSPEMRYRVARPEAQFEGEPDEMLVSFVAQPAPQLISSRLSAIGSTVFTV
jgi:hypothetical protein